ncbi:hypothetical protein [Candidatus Burkholderia verschuerenii]|uniref:hypothetical protein n=1 Tax=Candidatus Burkholderia verschuerenii TaxID=242163 RepID=UPI00067D97ED|nr:hypothetical protein [Candidatus Burkholderia verschuerenii]
MESRAGHWPAFRLNPFFRFSLQYFARRSIIDVREETKLSDACAFNHIREAAGEIVNGGPRFSMASIDAVA